MNTIAAAGPMDLQQGANLATAECQRLALQSSLLQ